MTGIVFDMDDTLYKELDYRDSGYRTVARHFAASCGVSADDLYKMMVSDPSQAFERVEALASVRGIEVSVDQQLMVYRSHFPDIKLDDSARFTLTELRQMGVPAGLLTDGRAWGQLNKIAALRLPEYIDVEYIIPTVLYSTDKNHPESFGMMADILRERGADTLVYVGDNPVKDFHYPNLMGWRTVMLRDDGDRNVHSQNLQNYAPSYRPQIIIEDLREVLRLVKF